MQIQLESPAQPDVTRLIAEIDACHTARYPTESNHLPAITALMQPQVLFAVARAAAGEALGCAALVLAGDSGELKRMYVPPRRRGQGVAKGLMQFLESEAGRRGCTVLRLETGIHQPEAQGLYAAAGYARSSPFGDYTEDPLSVFMQKRLATVERGPAAGPR